MVFEAGLEPAAFRLSGERSNQLSYTNIIHYLEDTLRLQPTPVDLVHPAKESRT